VTQGWYGTFLCLACLIVCCKGARGATLDFRCVDISARQSAGAHARQQTARAGSVDTLPATCHVLPLGGAAIEVGNPREYKRLLRHNAGPQQDLRMESALSACRCQPVALTCVLKVSAWPSGPGVLTQFQQPIWISSPSLALPMAVLLLAGSRITPVIDSSKVNVGYRPHKGRYRRFFKCWPHTKSHTATFCMLIRNPDGAASVRHHRSDHSPASSCNLSCRRLCPL
jgi:hypothetical protein